MSKIKIDFIIGRMLSGGAERVVANLANYFAENGHTVRIITFSDAECYELNSNIERIRFHNNKILKKVLFRSLYYLFHFYKHKQNRPDVISSHIGLMGLATIPNARLFNIKIIISEHFNHIHQEINFFQKILWNHFYKHIDALTILTKYDQDFFETKTKKVVVMENPCSFDMHDDLDSPREKVILAVGNLNRYTHKGFDNLLEIVATVLPKYPNWKLKLVGAGEEGLKLLSAKSQELGVSNQIIFTGFRSDIKKLMINSEIFLLTSRYEGLPMVLIEALSQGLACISYDCVSGPSDILTNNLNGMLVNNQDKLEMSEKLELLISDNELRKKYRSNSAQQLKKFTIDNVGKKWLKLINEII